MRPSSSFRSHHYPPQVNSTPFIPNLDIPTTLAERHLLVCSPVSYSVPEGSIRSDFRTHIIVHSAWVDLSSTTLGQQSEWKTGWESVLGIPARAPWPPLSPPFPAPVSLPSALMCQLLYLPHTEGSDIGILYLLALTSDGGSICQACVLLRCACLCTVFRAS